MFYDESAMKTIASAVGCPVKIVIIITCLLKSNKSINSANQTHCSLGCYKTSSFASKR